jgi:hypothetical protein
MDQVERDSFTETNKISKQLELIGRRYGRLTVTEYADVDNYRKIRWKCRCSCGQEIVVRGTDLRTGSIASCGCSRIRHGHTFQTSDGRKKYTRVYMCWKDMKAKCLNPKRNNFKHYGGLGISVCERWRNSFEAFLQDMGEPPTPEHSIDMIDNNGNYEPSNCKWSTEFEKSTDRRLKKTRQMDSLEFSF